MSFGVPGENEPKVSIAAKNSSSLVSPTTSAMVGDEPELDIKPASTLGMFTVLLEIEGNKIPSAKPNFTIRELKELLQVFP